jgi:hypothetical protein
VTLTALYPAQQSVTGPQGATGATGAMIDSGTGAPTSGVGNNGDWYINTSNYCLYGPKASGSWPGTCQLMITAIPTTVVKQGSAGGPLSYSTTTHCANNTTGVIIDGTNLEYAVVVPSGWKLLISATAGVNSGVAGEGGVVGLYDVGASVWLTGGVVIFTSSTANAGSVIGISNIVVNGDGNTHTIALAWCNAYNDGSTIAMTNGVIGTGGGLYRPTMTFFLTPSN